MKTDKLEQQLYTEFIRRSTVGSPFHVLIALLIWVLFGNLTTHPWWWSLSLCLASLAGGLRFITRGIKSSRSLQVHFRTHATLLLVSASVWGILSAYSIAQNGLYSLESLALIFINCGVLCGTLHLLSPAPAVQKASISLMILPFCATIFFRTSSLYETSISGLFLIYLAYLWTVSNMQSSELRKHLISENLLMAERDKIQQVVNSVPGFVFTINNENKVSERSLDLIHRFGYCFRLTNNNELFGLENSPLTILVNHFRSSTHSSATQELELGPAEGETASRSWHLISMTKNPLLEDEIVVVGIPISELKEAQEMVKVQTAKAEHSARPATLGEMAGGIAHEINNPLAVIMGAATQIDRLTTQQPLPLESVQTKAKKIVATCQRISKIIQGLRTFSRQGDQDPFSSIDMVQLLEDTLELCRERFYRSGVNIMIEPIPPVALPGRAVQLSQVILNLLNNSFDAMEQTEDKFVEIKFKETATHFSIFISDSGPGIPEAIASRIFNPFFTTKEVGKGTGLGLSIAKGIIEDHQGELSLHGGSSTTTFEIKLPLTRKSTTPLTPKIAA